MLDSEENQFAAMVTDVMSYYGRDASTFTIGLFWEACRGFEFEQVSRAFNDHAKDAERGQYAPKVADIVRALQGTQTDRAALAWGKVLGAVSSVGAYQDVVFDDPAIHAAIADCGGWQKVCRVSYEELSYMQHRFAQSHKAYTQRGRFDYPRMLTGDRSPDAEYARRGLPPPKPAIVGDYDQAMQVMREGGEGGPRIAFNLSEMVTKAIGRT